MSGAIPPLLQYAFTAWCLFKHRDFTFTFIHIYAYVCVCVCVCVCKTWNKFYIDDIYGFLSL
jgi:hypothetical protein